MQLLITFGFVCVFTFSKATQEWCNNNPWLLWIALVSDNPQVILFRYNIYIPLLLQVVLIVTMISMACCEGVRRKTPMNFIFLFLFTLAESFLLGMIAGQYQANEVIMAVGITAAVCLGLTLFALQTKWDFTMCGGVLVVCLVVFIIFGIIAIFIPGQILAITYASLGVLLFSVYLVYDTQLMLGGNHKYAISPEEYIFAALNLYLDIVNIFMYILSIIGLARS